MKRMKSTIVTVVLSIFLPVMLQSQESNCIVGRVEISGAYSGGCKNGMAHGKGIARGIDTYEGQFRLGLPDGKGTYKWADGSYYTGMWSKGQRSGKGIMVYADSTQNGYWENDIFVGEKLVPDYEVIRYTSVSRYTIRKVPGSLNEVKIRFLQAGSDNDSVRDLILSYSSGDEYRDGRIYGLNNCHFPITIKTRYRSSNLMRTSNFLVEFEFRINKPGTWEVIINN